jgi:transcriptional regulator with XRE-family HTH domain
MSDLRRNPSPTADLTANEVAEQADSSEARMRAVLGKRVRQARSSRGLTAHQLAELTGVTRSFISQIERGQASPSVTTMYRIAHALGLSLGDLFDIERPSVGAVLEPADWHVYDYGHHDGVDAILALDPERRYELIWTRFPPGLQPNPLSHAAEVQIVFVLSGEIDLLIDGKRHRLYERCTIMFDGRTPHAWSNHTEEPTEILAFLTPAI